MERGEKVGARRVFEELMIVACGEMVNLIIYLLKFNASVDKAMKCLTF